MTSQVNYKIPLSELFRVEFNKDAVPNKPALLGEKIKSSVNEK